jgi:hypothetical protein
MKRARHAFRLTAAVVAIAGSLTLGMAADDIIWTWDDPDVLGSWGTAWGPATTTQDPFEDNTGNGGGSLYIETGYTADDQNAITVMGNYGGWFWNGDVRSNLLDYVSLEFDIKWDPTSTISIDNFNTDGGDNGLAIWNARFTTDWEWIEFGRILVPNDAATGWAHVSVPIDPTTASLDQSAGIVFKKWIPADVAAAGGVAAFWLDNVELVARSGELEPPTMSLSSDATAGLNLITLAGGQWQRQGIRTVNENFSWVGSGTPTTYEFTVSEMPGADYAGFSAHVYLVANDPRDRVDPDWAHPDVVRFDMSLQDDGTYLGTIRYKIDSPESNGEMFGGAGELGSITSATVIGPWGFTFNNDTSITLISPDGTADVTLPDTAVAEFDAPLAVYYGVMANQLERQGQKVVLAQARIQGAVGGVDVTDDFPGPLLDTTTWELAAEYPDGVMILTDDAALWLSWTLPDSGFSLQAATGIEPAGWAPFAGSTPPLPTGPTKSVLINKSDLPGAAAAYFQLNQPVFSKLQILLPGETAAPGTPTGKTGTPDPQTQYTPFDVRINAVSDDWALISGITDTVTLTTTDGDPLLPPDAALVNGTVTMTVDLGTVGTQTITVSDVTDPAIQSDTSSGVTIIAQ